MKSEKAFTLIELMVVVVIIGILAAIAIPNWVRMQTRAQESDIKSVAHTVQISVEDYKTSPGKEGVKPLVADRAYVMGCLLPINVFQRINPFNRPNTYGATDITFNAGPVTPSAGQVAYCVDGGASMNNAYEIIAQGKNWTILTLMEGS